MPADASLNPLYLPTLIVDSGGLASPPRASQSPAQRMPRLKLNSPFVVLAACVLLTGGGRGQGVTPPVMTAPVAAAPGPIAPAAPLVLPGEVPAAPGGWIMREAAAERALELGFSPAAEALLQELLLSPDTPAAQRSRLELDLVAALLDQGRLDDADKALGMIEGAHNSAYHLRAGLIAAYRRQVDAARREAAQVKIEELAPAERGWYRFLEGMIADLSGDLERRNQDYDEAVKAAVSEIQRARFQLEQLRVNLLSGPATEQEAARLKQNMERLQGQKPGYAYARYYAAALNALGRKSEAVDLLQHQLQSLPPEERQELDDMRLLLGLIAGGDSGVGRNALFGLLDHAVSPESQRIALQLLARASTTGAARAEFRTKLDRLIAAPVRQPIIEDLRVFRAQAALAEKDYDQANEDAKWLLDNFPGSRLKTQALGVLTSVAWEQGRYRTAADDAAQLRAELPPGDARARLGVLVAEADFRAGDFRNAADAYGSAQREPPAGVAPGALLFQRVLAEIDSDQLAEAQKLLDDAAGMADVAAVSRWQAEWNLARALQVHDQTAEALKRVTRLVDEAGAAALPPELFVRMSWLQAHLAFEAGPPAEAIRLVDALLACLETPAMAALPAALKTEVVSTSVLLKAQALLKADQAAAGLALLTKLRTDYPKSDAAVYSFVVEANYHATRYEISEAQSLFTHLADTYPDSKIAPFALYEAALNAERRGQDAYYEDALRLIERLVTTYPQSDLVFYARMKEGDLLRKLNHFAPAQRTYEWLVDNFPQHRDVLLAQLALGDCHYAQAASDPSHWESAETIYERLQDYPTAPVDLRVEAGFKHGYTQLKRGSPARAEATWWLVTNLFLLDANRAAELGAKGRYWMARTLLELGDLYEKQSQLDQARNAYELILKQGLPGQALAQQRLARFLPAGGSGAAKP
jgi:outer membrane protein assembly factor BamD (BamD/ComL family)